MRMYKNTGGNFGKTRLFALNRNIKIQILMEKRVNIHFTVVKGSEKPSKIAKGTTRRTKQTRNEEEQKKLYFFKKNNTLER